MEFQKFAAREELSVAVRKLFAETFRVKIDFIDGTDFPWPVPGDKFAAVRIHYAFSGRGESAGEVLRSRHLGSRRSWNY
jgi:hypothetical protein